jgi:hypothetical protein
MLMEKVSAGQYSFLCSYDAIYACVVENTGLISLIGISDFRQMEGTWISNVRRHKNQFDLGTHETRMGGSRDGCNGTTHSAIEHFWMESEAYKICEGWTAREGYAAVPTNTMRRSES